MKKFLSFLLVFMLVMSISMNISMAKLDETGAKEISFGTSRGPEDAIIRIADKTYPVKNGTILFINGEIIPEAEVIMDGGNVMIPLRLIAEKLGYEVGWNGAEKKVTLKKADNSIVIATTKNEMAKLIKSTTYVSPDFVEKNLAESAVVTESLGNDFKKFYETDMPISQDKTIERSLRNVIIDEKHEYKDNISSDDAMKLVKEKCLEGLKNFEKTMKEKAKDEPGRFDDDIKLIEKDINRMIYIGEVSKFYRYTIGPYDVLYDRTDGKIYFQIYQAETRIKEVDVNDPNLYLAIFIVG
ncbi:copper amine oxidase N-terminal domain-containing protein [Ezakiella coagulans]|uniref:copper amine oxidase N-terminal domain-containing protein n=1 Tax=Ezakiella coagulans TaxID=46507 RepID=UPI00288A75A6|nr:copper amine oxidase N-terminal domain-containing protein [Ezakiella coagulans]